MATPNYGYEKRQRELAKKQKKEDKLREKAQRKLQPDSQAPGEAEEGAGAAPAKPGEPTQGA